MDGDKGKKSKKARQEALYDNLVKEKSLQGVEYIDFEETMKDPQNQHKLYSNIKQAGKTDKTFQQFQEDYFYDLNNPTEIAAPEKKKTEQPITTTPQDQALSKGAGVQSPDKNTINAPAAEDGAPETLTPPQDNNQEETPTQIAARQLKGEYDRISKEKQATIDVLNKRLYAQDISLSDYDKLKSKAEQKAANDFNTYYKATLFGTPSNTEQVISGALGITAFGGNLTAPKEPTPLYDEKILKQLDETGVNGKEWYNRLTEEEKSITKSTGELPISVKGKIAVDKIVKDNTEKVWDTIEKMTATGKDFTYLGGMGDTRYDMARTLADGLDLPEDQKAMVKKAIEVRLDGEKNQKIVEERMKESAAKIGIKLPAETMSEFSKKATDLRAKLNLQVTQDVATVETDAKAFQEKMKVTQNNFVAAADKELEGLRQSYQEQIKNSPPEQRETLNQNFVEQYNKRRAEIIEQGKQLNAQMVADQTAYADKLKAKIATSTDGIKSQYDKDLAELAKAHNIKIDGEDVAFTDEYLAQIKALQGTHYDQVADAEKSLKNAVWDNLGIVEKFQSSAATGMLNLANTIGAGITYFSPNNKMGDWVTRVSDLGAQQMPKADFENMSFWEKATDLDYLISSAGEQLPMMALPMGAGAKTFQFVAGMLGKNSALSAGSRLAIASMASGGASRVVENSMEALNGFNTALRSGKTFAEAYSSAKDIFDANSLLMLTDWAQYGMAYASKAKKLITSSGYEPTTFLKSVAIGGGKLALQAETEAVEETYQEYQQAKKESPLLTYLDFVNSPQGKEVQDIARITGGMFQVMEGRGGMAERYRYNLINSSIQSYFNKFKEGQASFEDIYSRHVQLSHTLDTLLDRGEIDKQEYDQAIKEINSSLEVYKNVSDGTASMPEGTGAAAPVLSYDDYRFGAFHSLAMQEQAVKDKLQNAKEDQKETLKQELGIIQSKKKDLVKIDGTPIYNVDGVSLSKDEFYSLLNDEKNDAIWEELAQNGRLATNDAAAIQQLSEKSQSYKSRVVASTQAGMVQMGFTPEGETSTKEQIDSAIALTEQEIELTNQAIEENPTDTQTINRRAEAQGLLGNLKTLRDFTVQKEQITEAKTTEQQDVKKEAVERATSYVQSVSPLGKKNAQPTPQEISLAQNKLRRDQADVKQTLEDFQLAENAINEQTGSKEVNTKNIDTAIAKTENKLKEAQSKLAAGDNSVAKTVEDLSKQLKALQSTRNRVENGMTKQRAADAVQFTQQIEAGMNEMLARGAKKEQADIQQKAEQTARAEELVKPFVREGAEMSSDSITAALNQQQSKLDAQKRAKEDTAQTEQNIKDLQAFQQTFKNAKEKPVETERPAAKPQQTEQKPAEQEQPTTEQPAAKEQPKKQPSDTQAEALTVEPAAEEQPTEETPAEEQPKEQKKPEMVEKGSNDTPIDDAQDRDRGWRILNGVKYYRQKFVDSIKGLTSKFIFSKRKGGIVEGYYAIIEADDLQPSHILGYENPKDFLISAQPKDRTKGDTMKTADAQKGSNLRFFELGASPNGYFGSPVVNERGEGIQGNGRAAGIIYYYNNHYQQDKKSGKETYADWIKQNADQFGIDPSDVDKFKKPVLVRIAPVDDAKAIELGGFGSSELEDQAQASALPVSRFRRMKETEKQAVQKMLLKDMNVSGKEKGRGGAIMAAPTVREAIEHNGKNILDFLAERGIVTPSEKQNYVNTNGDPTTTGTAFLESLALQYVLEGSNPMLHSMFEDLPSAMKNAIIRSILPLISVEGDAKKILEDLQDVMVLYKIYTSQMKGKGSVDTFLNQYTMTSDGRTMPTRELYSITPAQEQLLKMFEQLMKPTQGKKISQLQVAEWFTDYYNLTRDIPGDLMTGEQKGIPKDAAINIIYEKVFKNEQNEQNKDSEANSTGKGGGNLLSSPKAKKTNRSSSQDPNQGYQGNPIRQSKEDLTSAEDTVGTDQNRAKNPQMGNITGTEQAQTQASLATGRIAISPIPRSRMDEMKANRKLPKVREVLKMLKKASRNFFAGMKVQMEARYISPRAKDALGTFNRATGEVRVDNAEDIDVIVHENGHLIHAAIFKGRFDINNADDTTKQQLFWFSQFGSQPQSAAALKPMAESNLIKRGNPTPTQAEIDAEIKAMQEDYELWEGFAEFFRAWVYNPAEAMARGKGIWNYFNKALDYQIDLANKTGRKVDKNTRLQGLIDFSENIRILGSMSPEEQANAKVGEGYVDIKLRPMSEKLKKWISDWMVRNGFFNINGDPLYMTFMDRMNARLFDRFSPINKTVKLLQEMYNINPNEVAHLSKTDQDIYLMSRILQGRNAKVENLSANGLVFADFDKAGNMGYKNAIDPVTGQLINMDWLMSPLADVTDPKQREIKIKETLIRLENDRKYAGNVMTAQRTVELAERNTLRWWQETTKQLLMLEKGKNVTEDEIAAKIAEVRSKMVADRLEKELGRTPTQSEIDAEVKVLTDAASDQGIADLKARLKQLEGYLKAPVSSKIPQSILDEIDDIVLAQFPELSQREIEQSKQDLQDLIADIKKPYTQQSQTTKKLVNDELTKMSDRRQKADEKRVRERLGAAATPEQVKKAMSDLNKRRVNRVRAQALEKVFGKWSKMKNIEDEVEAKIKELQSLQPILTAKMAKRIRLEAIEIVLGKKHKNFEQEVKNTIAEINTKNAQDRLTEAQRNVRIKERGKVTKAEKKRSAEKVKALEKLRDRTEKRINTLEKLRTNAINAIVGQAQEATDLNAETRRFRMQEAVSIFEQMMSATPSLDYSRRIAAQNGVTVPAPQTRYQLAIEELANKLGVSEKSIDPKAQRDAIIQLIASQPIQVYDNGGITGISVNNQENYIVAKQILDNFENTSKVNPAYGAKINEFIRRYRMWGDVVLQYARDHGFMSEAQYQEVKENNVFYVALQRIHEGKMGEDLDEMGYWRQEGYADMQGEQQGKKPSNLKQAKGQSGLTRQDPTEAMMRNFVNTIQKADNNYVLNRFFDLLRPEKHEMASTRFLAQIGTRVTLEEGARLKDEDKIIVYNNGKQEIWHVRPELAEALRAVQGISPTRGTMQKIIDVAFGAPLRFMQKMITQNLPFALINYIRDTKQRWVQSRTAKGIPMGAFVKKVAMGKEAREKLMRDFEVYGGGQSGYDFYFKDEQSYYKAQYAAMYKIAKDGKSFIPNAGDVIWDKAKGFFSWFGGRPVQALETSNRTDEYMTAYNYYIKQGLSEYAAAKRAAMEARDLMDFAVAGTWAKTLGNFIPFYNPNVQGLNRFAKAMREGFSRKNPSIALRFMLYAAGTTIPNILSYAFEYEDEYEELPAWQRDMFLNFKLPGYDGWMSIPKPFEAGAFGSFFDRMVSAAKGYGFDTQSYVGSTLRGLIPLAKEDFLNFLGFYKPFFESIIDWDNFRQKVIMDGEGQLDISQREKYKDASTMALLLHGKVADARQIDHCVDTWFGWWGKMFQKTINTWAPIEREKPAEKKRLFGADDVLTTVLKEARLYREREPYSIKSVTWVMEKATSFDLKRSDDYAMLHKLAQGYKAHPSDAAFQNVIDFARRIKSNWEKKLEILERINSGEIKVLQGQPVSKMSKKDIRNQVFGN